MNYSKLQILKAAELSGLSEGQAQYLCSLLNEAVKLTELVLPTTLEGLFELFLLNESINKEEFLSKNRKNKLFEYRIKFTKLAKETFGKKANSLSIGKTLNRDHASVLRYLKIIKAEEKKLKKVKKLKYTGTPFDEWPKKYELTNLLMR